MLGRQLRSQLEWLDVVFKVLATTLALIELYDRLSALL
jgi:hypothetical protein